MMHDYGTDNFLRNEIANAERYRTELDIKLAGYRTNVAQCEAKIEALNTRITDLTRLLDFHKRYEAEQAAPDVDDATEAFVDVADAERYAQRDEYVNSADAEAEQIHRKVEHADYAEAEAVREIEEEMALEAAGVESWDQL